MEVSDFYKMLSFVRLSSMILKFSKITSVGLLYLCLASCAYDIDTKGGIKGNGNIAKEDRLVRHSFDTVVSTENVAVFVSQKEGFGILVEADNNIIDFIRTDIENNTLTVHTSKNLGRATKKVFISLPKVASLRSGTGSILQTQGTITTDHIGIAAGTGSLLHAQVQATDVWIDGKEGARLRVSGRTENARVETSSGSYINAKHLESFKCTAVANYGGNIEIQVSDSLVANANTGGTISYIGSPKVDMTNTFSGDVQQY